jgi:hypothetical protein
VRAGKALEEQSSGEYRPVCRRDSAGSERTHEGVKTAESVKHSEARSQDWRASERDTRQLVKRELALRGDPGKRGDAGVGEIAGYGPALNRVRRVWITTGQ